MPGVSVEINRDHDENSRRQQLLALCGLRRGVERVAAPRTTQRKSVALTTAERLRELQELIAALDRRVPQIERSGEAAIAKDAAALRRQAMKRLAELEDVSQSVTVAAQGA